MFGNFGMGEMLLVLLVVLLLFGAKRLPELGGAVGKGLREFRRATSGSGADDERPPAAPVESPAPPSARIEGSTKDGRA